MNKKQKIRVGLLFGGKSAEHEVSLRSAENVANAINKDKYDLVLIGIDKTGKWLLGNSVAKLLDKTNPKLYKLNNSNTDSVVLVPNGDKTLTNLKDTTSKSFVDVIFPILHGPFGEDGTIQGLLKLANIPFVGSGVLGSAVGMDKDVMKRLLRDAGIQIGNFITVTNDEKISFAKARKILGLPMFIKPANMGSSVGVSKVRNKNEYEKALALAFEFDTKVIIEEFIEGREIECSVLGNENPKTSVVGEVILSDDFYSYETKYIDENGATIEIPAKLSKKVIEEVQQISIKAFKVLSCEGFARADFFVDKNNKVYLNELNTIPGFTSISMYPKLWEDSGVSYTELIDILIQLALERFEKEKKLKTSYV